MSNVTKLIAAGWRRYLRNYWVGIGVFWEVTPKIHFWSLGILFLRIFVTTSLIQTCFHHGFSCSRISLTTKQLRSLYQILRAKFRIRLVAVPCECISLFDTRSGNLSRIPTCTDKLWMETLCGTFMKVLVYINNENSIN